MTNKEAIRILGLERDDWETSHCMPYERREAFEMAITALNQLDNNSTKPDNSTATQFNGIESKVKGLTACRVPEDDCISRADVEQTVEDNILCYTHSDRPIDQDPDTECHMAIRTALRMLRKDLRKLPSVQPLVIHCTDCEDWHERQSISGFTISELPSAQPDLQSTCNQLATDCISRQDAIDHWRLIIDATNINSRYNMGFVDGLEFCINHLITMPSAQSERDIPRKAIKEIDRSLSIPIRQALCPNCNSYLDPVLFIWADKRRKVTYCERCGQAIDWEGWDEE